MAEERTASSDTLLDLEKELSCSICTDIFYQPLTLLDCLHTFCGGCLKEWFTWQAEAAGRNRSATRHPYTCPSCRDSVRGTKADWRLSTLLEGYLKANPDKGKTKEEKEEMRAHYKPGDNVLPEVRRSRDSADERLLADVRDLSMAGVDPEVARRRAQRDGNMRADPRPSSRDTGQRTGSGDHNVEHQPSLRNLLGASEVSSQEMQQEILQSIYAEGLLDGIDVDNLSLEQEEELTERIAEAYRRRQRQRERSRNPDRRNDTSRSPQPAARDAEPSDPAAPQQSGPSAQQSSPRSRPPNPRPHQPEQASANTESSRNRSDSSTGRQGVRPTGRTESLPQTTEAARSATDLSGQPSTDGANQQQRRRAASSEAARGSTEPEPSSNRDRTVRNMSGSLRPESGSPRARSSDSRPSAVARRPVISTMSNTTLTSSSNLGATQNSQQAVRPAVSVSNFAPEAVRSTTLNTSAMPSVSCSRCDQANIQETLHYNCPKCSEGNFSLCLACYRGGSGCNHWFGFGFRAMERWRNLAPPDGWPRNYEYPHVLMPRRYQRNSAPTARENRPPGQIELQEGTFCDSCLGFANDCYWYCEICQDGSWGFCNPCVLQGRHCTHPLLPLSHLSTQPNGTHDPSTVTFVPLPHLRSHSYVLLPMQTDCDLCRLPIGTHSPRFHCHICSDGNYDICQECYTSLASTGQLAPANGPQGWRRCPHGHRMAVIGFQESPFEGGGHVRIVLREPVGGWRFKESDPAAAAQAAAHQHPSSMHLPPDGGGGTRYLASWSWFPAEGNTDELAFPRNAEIREAEDLNEDWSVGVYAAAVGVFPRNHVRA